MFAPLLSAFSPTYCLFPLCSYGVLYYQAIAQAFPVFEHDCQMAVTLAGGVERHKHSALIGRSGWHNVGTLVPTLPGHPDLCQPPCLLCMAQQDHDWRIRPGAGRSEKTSSLSLSLSDRSVLQCPTAYTYTCAYYWYLEVGVFPPVIRKGR